MQAYNRKSPIGFFNRAFLISFLAVMLNDCASRRCFEAAVKVRCASMSRCNNVLSLPEGNSHLTLGPCLHSVAPGWMAFEEVYRREKAIRIRRKNEMLHIS